MTLGQTPVAQFLGSFFAAAASNLHKNSQAAYCNPNRF